MENTDAEEVTLDIEEEAEAEAKLKPRPKRKAKPRPAKVESDPAAEAFARLEGEMALMRRAVQHLAAERADIIIPDYGATLTEMAKRLEEMVENLDCIEEHPAMQVTPDSFGRRIEVAAEAARRGDQTRINNAYNELQQATQDMRGVTSHARASADQRRKVIQAVGGGVLGGILLWSFLPGTIARAVPESWHWPERMAAGMVGESSRWDAGTRLMRSESPQALNALERAADLLRDNREAIEACQKSAANAKQPVLCTVRIRAGSESRN
ncbi:MAG: DUF6118 family protein [Sphingorhabdus sp.]